MNLNPRDPWQLCHLERSFFYFLFFERSLVSVIIEQWFSTVAICLSFYLPRKCFITSENIFGSYSPGGGGGVVPASGRQRPRVLLNIPHEQYRFPTTKNHLAQDVSSAEVVKAFAGGKVIKLRQNKVGEDWKMERLEDKITNRMALKFQKKI